jgi:hypothetical protein
MPMPFTRFRSRTAPTNRVATRCQARFAALFIALLFGRALPASALEPYSIESIELNTADKTGLDKALADKLDPHGSRLTTESNGLKVTVCEVFWAREVAGQAGRAGAKSYYQDLQPGSLVGVIHFLPETDEDYREDFHDQKLAPGYYTMRYASQAHSEPSDVLMLSPLSADRGADSVVASNELERRSRLASGTKEPAVLSLVSPESSKEAEPRARMDEQGTCIFQVKVHVKPATGSPRDATLAVILVTPRSQDDGS